LRHPSSIRYRRNDGLNSHVSRAAFRYGSLNKFEANAVPPDCDADRLGRLLEETIIEFR
jgi:hypothetical protein